MENYYYENVTLQDEQKERCHIALMTLSQINIPRIFSKAVKVAHEDPGNPIAPQVFWENLFLGIKPLQEEGRPNRRSSMPEDPYKIPDIQCWVKYLSFDRQDGNIPLADADAFFRFFQISKQAYRVHTNAMKFIRNDRIDHVAPIDLEKLNISKLTKHRDAMLGLLEPLCQVQWEYQQDALALRSKILETFYNCLGQISYDIGRILRYIEIPPQEQAAVEKLLNDAGLSVEAGKITLDFSPTVFANELLGIWKRTDLSPEAQALQLKLRLPGNEEALGELIAKDPGTRMDQLSDKALAEMVNAGNSKAQMEMARRLLFIKQDGNREENQRRAMDLLRKAAESGLPRAQGALGFYLQRGKYIEQDPIEAIFWLRSSAKSKDGYAHVDLGKSYEQGIGVEKDEKEAFRWYCLGAELGNTDASLAKARCLENGVGTDKDSEEALFEYQVLDKKGVAEASWHLALAYKEAGNEDRWLNRLEAAAAGGFVQAQYDLANFYSFNHYFKDVELAAKLYEKAAQGGEPNSQYLLGTYFEYGRFGKPRDTEQALYWYTKAANQKHIDSCLKIGRCYLEGRCVKKDEKKARAYLLISAKAGNKMAQYLLGRSCLDTNSNVPTNASEGLKWLEQAAERIPDAALCLGEYYENQFLPDESKVYTWYKNAGPEGLYRLALFLQKQAVDPLRISRTIIPGVSFESPISLLLSAAEKGHKDAQYQLFQIYWKGLWHENKDAKKAIFWLNEAAKKGHPKAFHQLGIFYSTGVQLEGKPLLPQNQVIAAEWLGKALSVQNYEHRERVQEALKKLNT